MIQVAWFDENQKAIVFKIEGTWTWDEFYASVKESDAMLDASSLAQIHMVLDYTKGALFPRNVVSNMARNSRKTHPKTGLTIVVGGNGFLRALFRIMESIAPKQMEKVRFVKNLDEVPPIINASFV